MKLTVLNIAFDSLFSFFSAFLIFFIITNYFTDRTGAIVLSLTFSLVFSLFAFKKILSSVKSKAKKNELDFKAKEYIRQFAFMSETETVAFFKKVFFILGKETRKRKNSLVIPCENKAVFFFLGLKEPEKSDIIKVYNAISKEETAEIFCVSYSKELNDFTSRFEGKITLKNEREVYGFLEKSHLFPEICFPLNKKNGIKEFLFRFFDKKRAKTFFLFGIAFAFLSFFVKFKGYYAFFSGMLLLFAILCRLFGKERKV
ncbi:MAG: hypothetical protein J6Y43_01085 [Clostridia bacterium]|nr:hypothetical protein [Clostridia bacterium]